MTMKQCNSCKWHICVKELDECCFSLSTTFYGNKNCHGYEYGEINQGHKEFFEKCGREYPFTELR